MGDLIVLCVIKTMIDFMSVLVCLWLAFVHLMFWFYWKTISYYHLVLFNFEIFYDFLILYQMP